MTVDYSAEAPCEFDCNHVTGISTRVRVDGVPGHFGCWERKQAAGPVEGDQGDAGPVEGDQGDQGDQGDAEAAEAGPETLRFLADLEKRFAPKRRSTIKGRTAMNPPYWRPTLPGAMELVRSSSGWSWSREYAGATVTLDRSGAWISAASSVDVAHGKLEHTGPGDHRRPGIYKVAVYPWNGDGPNPLGHVVEGESEVWVTWPRFSLLVELAEANRWPDAVCVDSWTGDPVRLRDWATHVNAARTEAIERHGRDSDEYNAVKVAFSQAVTLMTGKSTPGQPRTYPKSPVHRADWGYSIQDQGAVTLWRWQDDCRAVAPEFPPVAMRSVDELVIPSEALPIVTTKERPGGRKPLQIDPTGTKLGTFKVKGDE
ncbi:hypothetical protein JIG36_51025 [Actinoplanes sp. LDG1-06]|uniref:Uncharacterized protein n=1 Tax=Paractinoplanes ovalisporus TaxID=2810368 RepID=A0ABS2AVS6_9ACTN|nr:hypothetical protein [Actinoplanes ovalisporus]MBM2623853.1 hypothetical protein [Actinoplanes ovalisporus]